MARNRGCFPEDFKAPEEEIDEADKAHLDELANDIAPRMARDGAVSALRQKLIDIRRIVQGLFSPERSLEIVAVDGPTAEQPELLWRQGEHTIDHLRAPDFETPEVSTSSVSFEPQPLADELEPMVTVLRESIDALEVERRAAATTHTAKLEAMAEHDALMGACGRILSGFYLLARRPDLARRIRVSLPYRSRPGSQNGEAPGEASPDDEPFAATDAEPTADSGGEPAPAP